MLPMPPSGTWLSRVRYDRSSLELNAYMRDEWRSNPDWLVRRPLRRDGSLWSRLRRWFVVRAREPARLRVGLSDPAPSDWLARADACPHLVTEDLGLGTQAQFLRCTECGDVLVLHAGREWHVGSAAEPSPKEPAAGELRPASLEELPEC